MFFPRQFGSGRRCYTLVAISLTVFLLLITLYNFYARHIYQMDSNKSSLKLSSIHQYTSPPRIFCLILTTPKYFLTRTKAVNDTWAPRCDRYFFVTESPQKNTTTTQLNFAKRLPIAPIKNITGGYNHLTQKSTLAFLFAYENYFHDYEWFVKADDDTYLFVDHLRTFLSEKNTSEPITYGYNFKVTITIY